MKIAVNTRLLLANRLEGIGRFAHEVLQRMVLLLPEHEFHFYFDRSFHPDFMYSDNVHGHVLSPQARHPILYNIWFHHRLPRIMRKHDIDLLFSPEGYIPLTSEIPMINVIHDINFEHHPELLDKAHSLHFRKYFPRYAQAASEVITVSDYSKDDICSTYAIPRDDVSVVYNGVSDEFKPLDLARQEEVRKKWTDGRPYFIFIGAIHPRKNLTRLIEAFDRFKESGYPHRLLLVGNKAFKNQSLEKALSRCVYRSDIQFTGRLPEDDMKALLASATALTFVPLFEGFGIPIIEAFKSGTPVISADVTALPEVAGDAAILIDPERTDEIARAMLRIVEEPGLTSRLSSQGLQRASLFNWDTTAEQISAIIQKHLGKA